MMMNQENLPINFTLSLSAKREIESLKRFWDAESGDPAAAIVIGWGFFERTGGERWENVIVSFYGQSQFADIEHGIQVVSGLPVVFFTTVVHYSKFEGKVVDHTAAQGFFLRDL